MSCCGKIERRWEWDEREEGKGRRERSVSGNERPVVGRREGVKDEQERVPFGFDLQDEREDEEKRRSATGEGEGRRRGSREEEVGSRKVTR